MVESTGRGRRLRADAQRNRERVLTAARDAFATLGPAVSLDEIAVRAGVGPGTVYRHFPSKQALFAAVAELRVRDLVHDIRVLHEAPDPGVAFDGLLARLVEEAEHKRDLTEAIAVPGPLRAELHEALGALLVRAQQDGAVRPDIALADLLALLKGLLAALHDVADPAQGARLLAVVRDGLRAR
jgi:AcrR family transcriptional regulator